MANAARPRGIATTRSRSGWVTTNPKSRSGVPVNQPNRSGTNVSGTNRRSRSSRIHDQLLAMVVRTTVVTFPSPARGGGSGWGVSIRVIDDVLDRFALGQNGPNQVLDYGLVIGMVRVGQ